jgi:starvation-inducible DNA-binding protein
VELTSCRNTFGRPFKPLHEHLDMLVDSWRELSDTVAERAVALGVAPDGQSTTVSAASGVAAVARGGLDTDSALAELVPRLADVAARIRTRMERTPVAWRGLHAKPRQCSPRSR